MALNYAKLFNRRATPQSQPIPGSTQVRNSDAGYSWQVDDWTRLDRFLILGAEGGTYYIAERDLVKQNHDAVVRCIKSDGVRVVNRIVEISDAGRAPKNDPAIFALALVATHGDARGKAAAFANLSKVCRIGTHLFHFAEYVNAMRGWGRVETSGSCVRQDTANPIKGSALETVFSGFQTPISQFDPDQQPSRVTRLVLRIGWFNSD